MASRTFARYLERLPLAVLERVAIEPIVRQELDMFSVCELPRLRELRVFGASVCATSLTSLALLTQLESLSLASSELGDEVFGLVSGLTRLTALSCAIMWRMTATSLQTLAAAAPRLERLALEFCMAGAPGVVSSMCDGRALIDNVLALRSLRVLEVNSVVFAGDELGALTALTALEELRVRDAALHAPGAALARLSALPRLHTLVLMFSRAPVQVRQLAGLTRLQRLALLGQTAAPGELAQLAQLSTLRALAVRRLNEAGDAAALAAALAAWQRGAAPLAEFSCSLQELDDPAELLALLPAAALRRLRLSQLEASARLDAAAAALARLGALELLDLDQARVADADLARLVAALPRLRRLSLFGCEAAGPRTVAALGAACHRLEALCLARILVNVPQHAALGSLAPLAAGCPRLAHLWLAGDRLVDDRELATAPPTLCLLDIARCPRVLQPAALARHLAARHGTRVLLADDDHAQLHRRQKHRQFGFFDEI